jgi:hydrogenase maturation factor HypF (carbamoyltransferase family)
MKWYSVGSYNEIMCSNCKFIHANLHDMDHHARICPNCNIECIWFDLGNEKAIQIIPNFAPAEFKRFIEWAQKELDELEFVNLLVLFEELNHAIDDC